MVERYDEELFLGFLEGDLTPERTAQFEKMLSEDARLRNLVAQLVLDRHRLRHMPMEAAPDEIMERVNQRLERRMLLDLAPGHKVADTAPIRRFHIGRLATYLGIAALVILGVGVISYSLFNTRIHNLATDSGLREPGLNTVSPNNPPPGMMAQGNSPAGRSSAFSEFSRSAPLLSRTSRFANSQALGRVAYESSRLYKARGDLVPAANPDEDLFQAPDTIANLIVEDLTGVPARDTHTPSLLAPEKAR